MNNVVKDVAIASLSQLKGFLSLMSDEHYTACSELLLGASIGQHVRHILEFYICLQEGCCQKVVNYDLRKRDLSIEQNRVKSIALIQELIDWISLTEEKTFLLEGAYGTAEVNKFSVTSHLERELIYNIEHAIHHMAIIKIAGVSLYNYSFPSNFGIADSTINHYAQHVHS